MAPPDGHDEVVHAHCLPVFREDGDGLMYVWEEAGGDATSDKPDSDGTPPACDGFIGSLMGLQSDSESNERLKRLLKTGLSALQRHM